MYSVATTGEANTNPAVYGAVLPFVLKLGDVVELVVNNLDAAIHPFHLHGHQFQVLERRASNAGRWTGRAAAARSVASPPPRRDTVNVDARSFAVLRFRVDHPGVFLFHCHVEWHVEMGLTATFIEAPEMLRGLTFPPDHLDNCRKLGIPVSGNAAGNAEPNNTAGFRTVPPTTYFGCVILILTPPSPPAPFALPRLPPFWRVIVSAGWLTTPLRSALYQPNIVPT